MERFLFNSVIEMLANKISQEKEKEHLNQKKGNKESLPMNTLSEMSPKPKVNNKKPMGSTNIYQNQQVMKEFCVSMTTDIIAQVLSV